MSTPRPQTPPAAPTLAQATSDPDSRSRRPYPHSQARSTGITVDSNASALLASILAAHTLDKISSGDDFSAVERYIRSAGRVNTNTHKTTTGAMFWLYPTGLYGPYHENENGQVEKHGTLVTVEKGVDLNEAVWKVKRGLIVDGIGHLHLAA